MLGLRLGRRRLKILMMLVMGLVLKLLREASMRRELRTCHREGAVEWGRRLLLGDQWFCEGGGERAPDEAGGVRAVLLLAQDE